MIDTGELVETLTKLQDILHENERLKKENDALKAKTDNRKKLTKKEAAEIRRLYRTTGYSQRELADVYDVHRATIGRIISRVYHKGA